MNDDNITVTVNRADLEAVCEAGNCYRDSTTAANRIRAAIPKPEWEPSDEMMHRASAVNQSVHSLKRLHATGIDLTLREGE